MNAYIEFCLKQKELREYGIYVYIYREYTGSDELVFTYIIEYEQGTDKKLYKRMKDIYSYQEGPGSYSGGWNTYEEALMNGVFKGFEIKQKLENAI